MTAKPELVVVTTIEEFDGLISVNSEFLVVATFMAPWSAKCADMMNLTREFIADSDMKQVLFIEMNAEEVPSISSKYGVTNVPYVVFIRNKKVIDRLSGSDVKNYAEKVMQLKGDGPSLDDLPVKCVKTKTGSSQSAVSTPKAPIEERLKKLINQAPVMVFMKGDADNPRCGFSRQVIQIVRDAKVPFETFDILEDEEVRQSLKTFSNWQTYPQVYIKGELIGGLDVIREMQDMGVLEETLAGTAAS